MGDRELLEMAAKAEGRSLGAWFEASANAWDERYAGFGCPGPNRTWNPLTDDGDALRLAVKLGMEVTAAPIHAYACRFGTPRGREVDEPHDGSDPCAAVRRAIVRAAAAIGQSGADGRERP